MELAEIVRVAGPGYCAAHASRLLPSQQRALRDIVQCRTPALGGSVYQCEECGAREYAYHSCRNRHCPKCQEDRAHAWLARLRARLLPCEHALLTFTLPHELHPVARSHQRIVYAALLREAAAALQVLAADPAWVGGTPGILAVLHTWSRTLEYHPHAHLLVTAGGLAQGGSAWRTPAHRRFLVPGYALSEIFRAKMRDAVARSGVAAAIDPRVWQRRWTVHVQQIGTGDHAALYLARYVYRVALTNARLERFQNGRVTFRYTHARTHTMRRATLPTHVFLTRFLQHVLPRGFTKIRSYGLLSPSRRRDLEHARRVLQTRAPTAAPSATAPGEATSPDAPCGVATGTDSHRTATEIEAPVRRCPVCHRGQLRYLARYPSTRAPPG